MIGRRAALAALDLAIVGATAVGLHLVGTQAVEFGSTAGKWVYAYLAPMTGALATTAAVGALGVAALYELARRYVDARPVAVVLAVLVVGIGVQLHVRGLYRHTMEAVVVSNVANSFYRAAERVGPLELLRDFDRVSRSLPLHARANMPGKTLLYQALRRVTSRPDAIAVAIVVLSSVSGVVLYAVCARLFGDRRIALDAMALWMLMPSKMGFHPLLNVVTPLPALLAVWAMVRHLQRPAAPWPVVVGMLAYATAMFDPHALWLGIVFAPAVVHAILAGTVSPARAGAFLAAALVAVVATHELVRWATGFDAWGRLMDLIGVFHTAQTTRSVELWRRVNVKDLALAAGPAISVVFVAACGLATWSPLRAARDGAGATLRTLASPGPATALMTLGVLAVLLGLGLDRGEVARLWIFLLAPMGVAVAWCLSRGPAHPRALVVAGTVAYATLTTAMVGYCVP